MKYCARGIVLLKLNTDRHEASRGRSAIAELLVLFIFVLALIVRLSTFRFNVISRNSNLDIAKRTAYT